MKRSFFYGFAIAAMALITACNVIPTKTTLTQNTVVGVLKGATTESLIPFSPYTSGNPVIATEAFAKPGVPQVLGSGGTNATFQNGDYFILNGAGTFALASAATTKTNLVPDGSKFIIQNYKSGISNPITYGSSCYAVTGTCPTALAYGDTWLYTVDQKGGVYRATKLGNADMSWTTANFLPITDPSILSTAAGRAKALIGMYNNGSGHNNAPKWNTYEMQYLQIGGLEYGTGTVRGIGFGYATKIMFSPAFLGYQEMNGAGGTSGDLFFATRAATTNTVPLERLRITAAGDIKTATGYVPATVTSLTPKNYVDGRSLSPAAITAIKALTPSSTLADVIAALQK